jgi:hypothetical protein
LGDNAHRYWRISLHETGGSLDLEQNRQLVLLLLVLRENIGADSSAPTAQPCGLLPRCFLMRISIRSIPVRGLPMRAIHSCAVGIGLLGLLHLKPADRERKYRDFNTHFERRDRSKLLYQVFGGFNDQDLHAQVVPSEMMGQVFEKRGKMEFCTAERFWSSSVETAARR